MNTECGTISKETSLNLIENDVEINNKLIELGITEGSGQLKVELTYSELLTDEEKKALKKEYKSKFSKKARKKFKKMGFVVKFSENSESSTFCLSDALCDQCYQNLQKRRVKNNNI